VRTAPIAFEFLATHAPDAELLERLVQVATSWGHREKWDSTETEAVRRASVMRQEELKVCATSSR
jgi:hypothetical protein